MNPIAENLQEAVYPKPPAYESQDYFYKNPTHWKWPAAMRPLEEAVRRAGYYWCERVWGGEGAVHGRYTSTNHRAQYKEVHRYVLLEQAAGANEYEKLTVMQDGWGDYDDAYEGQNYGDCEWEVDLQWEGKLTVLPALEALLALPLPTTASEIQENGPGEEYESPYCGNE